MCACVLVIVLLGFAFFFFFIIGIRFRINKASGRVGSRAADVFSKEIVVPHGIRVYTAIDGTACGGSRNVGNGDVCSVFSVSIRLCLCGGISRGLGMILCGWLGGRRRGRCVQSVCIDSCIGVGIDIVMDFATRGVVFGFYSFSFVNLNLNLDFGFSWDLCVWCIGHIGCIASSATPLGLISVQVIVLHLFDSIIGDLAVAQGR